ncbi:YkyA family protein [Halobacillus sp. KCTC 3957]|uniref:YkyA family protein n=2 Tax=Halobacillus yeomjeoni TaxID=311194 RepID=A0A931HT46_9BACI|nr:YkyA family protein [Halobacillus yeomjeoni]
MLMGVLTAVVLFLTACTGSSAQEEIYDHLEKAVTLEETFREQQKPLVQLENKEQELYNQIIDLSMNEFDKIKELSKEAAGIVEQRQEKLKLEKESIESAKEEFDQIKPLIDDIKEENQEAKEKAEQLYETMQKRYDSYQKLYASYEEALKLDSELYQMLQKEDLTEEELQKQIEAINESYNQVLEANEEFNQYTEEYNQLKKEFYQALDIEVTYEEPAEKQETESKDEKSEDQSNKGDEKSSDSNE